MTKRVLSWVNRQRVAAGAAPLDHIPAGHRHRPEDCPIARALGGLYTEGDHQTLMAYPGCLEVVGTAYDQWEIIRKIALPQYVGDAILRFDAGKYPELVA